MSPDVFRRLRERADGRCEYCRFPSVLHPAPFQVDHIIARQHGGTSEIGNLAYACIHCNRYKGPNVAGIDPDNRELVRLFHPRCDEWCDHFRWDGAEILPISQVGRVTVSVLFMNDPEVIWLRSSLMSEGPF